MDFKIESGIDIRFLTMVSLAANDLNVWINTAFYMKNYVRIGIAIRNTKISQILHSGYASILCASAKSDGFAGPIFHFSTFTKK
jgi:hypothetical protein